jgi:hypothetical protein
MDFNEKDNGVYLYIKGMDIEDNELLKMKVKRIIDYMKPINLVTFYEFENVVYDCDNSDLFTYTFPIPFSQNAQDFKLKICGECECTETDTTTIIYNNENIS